MSPESKRRRGNSDLVRTEEEATCEKSTTNAKPEMVSVHDPSLREDLDDVILVKEILVKQIDAVREDSRKIQCMLSNMNENVIVNRYNHSMITDSTSSTMEDKFQQILSVVSDTNNDIKSIKVNITHLGDNIERLDRRVTAGEKELGITPGTRTGSTFS